MKNYVFALFFTTIAFSFSACKTLNNVADPAHNSRNAVDWQGVYTGVLPCADCEGIQTVLRLDSNGKYKLETSYAGKSEKTDIQEGSFSWDKTGGRITLNDLDKAIYPIYYLVGENQLVQLNAEGKPIMSDLASKYILKKETNPIIEKYWKLVELNGRPIAAPEEGQREAYLILKSINSQVTGNGGCNGFGGNYELLPGNRIRFSQILSTMMACPNLNDEKELFEVLQTVDNYSYSNDTMTLNRAKMAPLARFVAVYF